MSMSTENTTTTTTTDSLPESPAPHPRPCRRSATIAGLIGRLSLNNAIGAAIAALFVILSLSSNAFLTKTNLLNVLQANAEIGIVACAGTLVIVAGCLDVSVGAIYALAAVVAAKVTITTASVPLGILAGLLTGAALGLFNGLMVTIGRVNSFIATLAGAILFQSAAQVITGGTLLTPTQPAYTTIGRGSFFGVHYSVWLFAALAAASGVLLARARFGRHVIVAGVNSEAARLSGVSVGRVRCVALLLSGVAAALAGVLVSSRSGQVDASVGGTSYVLQVIAAIAVGGTSLRGGHGSIGRTVLGVLFLGLVANGLNLLGVNPTYHQIFTGLLILIAVGADAATGRLSRDPS